jgi:hypothetical protein
MSSLYTGVSGRKPYWLFGPTFDTEQEMKNAITKNPSHSFKFLAWIDRVLDEGKFAAAAEYDPELDLYRFPKMGGAPVSVYCQITETGGQVDVHVIFVNCGGRQSAKQRNQIAVTRWKQYLDP